EAKPYPGWPYTFNQLDNYSRKAVAYLPTLEINQPNQVVQIQHEESKEVVYTLRINGKSFSPKVFDTGSYTIKIGEGDSKRIFKQVKTTAKENAKSLKVKLK
ncbi:MAG: hypothetical protein HOD72_03750, partial [Opitutae bacterium]|nr:hypothetical protein [Opitutae bacterium]